MIALLIFSLVWIALNVVRKYGYIKKNILFQQASDLVFKISIMSYLSVLAIGTWSYVPLFIVSSWILADLALNKAMKKEWLYVGNTAFMDRTFQAIGMISNKNPYYLMAYAKVIVFVICLCIFMLNK